MTRSSLMGSGGVGIFLASFCLSGCSAGGAPSFDLFGAFFPAWLLCGVIGIAAAGVARVAFISSGLANALPYQLTVCTAIGVIAALLIWLIGFGR
jgi:YtcA family